MTDITKDMVRTPYKSFFSKVCINKLQDSLSNQKISNGNEQDEILKGKPNGT